MIKKQTTPRFGDKVTPKRASFLADSLYGEATKKSATASFSKNPTTQRALINSGMKDAASAKKYSELSKKKMQAGGVMTPSKRVGPVDPNGAYTKVQERTIAGKKAASVPLKKDKQLGATKMKMGGSVKKMGYQKNGGLTTKKK